MVVNRNSIGGGPTPGGDLMAYDNGDIMAYNNGDLMIYSTGD
jgi:hypothetical protein